MVSVDEITDRLYVLTPEAFTQARNEAERDAGANADALKVKFDYRRDVPFRTNGFGLTKRVEAAGIEPA